MRCCVAGRMVHPRLMAVLRDRDEALMLDTFAILRDTVAEDTSGGFPATPGSVATGLCRLRNLNERSAETALASQLNWVMAYAVDLPYATSLTPADTLVVNGRNFAVGGVIDRGMFASRKTAVVKELGQ